MRPLPTYRPASVPASLTQRPATGGSRAPVTARGRAVLEQSRARVRARGALSPQYQ